MVMATAGVNGRMAKDKKKGSESKGKRGGGGRSDLDFLEQNSELRHTLAQIEKTFGEGAIMPLGADKQVPIEGISSGSLSVDLALGGKGFPGADHRGLRAGVKRQDHDRLARDRGGPEDRRGRCLHRR